MNMTLRVSEALAKDAGRGIVRLDPKDMTGLELQAGETVRLKGKRATVARAMPAFAADRGKATLQMDGVLRENSQVSLGEPIQIEKIPCVPGRTVVLAPIGEDKARLRQLDCRFLSRSLEGLAVTPGDKVRASFMSSQPQEFTVVDTDPRSPVLIGPVTSIRVKGDGVARQQKTGVTYEDVGGLHKEINRIREMIELPLKYPELFEKLGIDPPKGVLLHGPPGCGKTLIARAVAHETSAYFTHISGPEIMGKFYGESEGRLRKVFEEAQAHAPAILCIDEIDAIAPKREDMRGDQQVERRVVAQLLALMDGLESRGQLIVIGATNVPNMLDPALRRPGRFDREIAIGVPDRKGRKEVLEIHTRGIPLFPDVDLEKLAEITHGFVGADIAALCREAAMVTLRTIMPRISMEADYVPYELLESLQVRMEHFREALKDVEPSALREVFAEIPDIRWEQVGGLDEAKRVLKETIEWPLRYPDLFAQAGTKPPKGVLFTGPPGTGKTLLAKAVSNESQVNFISVKGPELLSRYVGESEHGIREVFKKARLASPCVVFFDEIESLASRRGAGGDSHVTDRVMSQLLTELDGIEELKGVVVLAATNRPDLLDPALLRTGRFELQIKLPAPDGPARREIFGIHCSGKPLHPDVDLDGLAGASEGLVGSDIEAICRRAALNAMRQLLETHSGLEGTPLPRLQIMPRHFQEALQYIARAEGDRNPLAIPGRGRDEST
ncbi:MAG: CDC48 family AAA ATPase [Chloroflexi bacterium]|nr:CDC48 family AAA ATPase [Chloroflexota bacterium]